MLKDSAEKMAELDESIVKWDPRMCEYFLSRDFPIPISCEKEKIRRWAKSLTRGLNGTFSM